jgi:DNA-binding response OmpR family regulator
MSETVKILVADDEEIGRCLLEAILLPEGYNIFFSSNGQEAFDTAKKEIPDIILLDVMMPMLDGFEVCRKIRENSDTAHITVFLITALDDRDSRIKGIDSGADDYISKPFDRVEILGKIKNRSNLIKKQKIRTVADGSPTQHPQQSETRSALLKTLIRRILTPPFSKNVLVVQSKETIVSRHAFIQKNAFENDYFLLLTNSLEKDITTLANSIFVNIWEKVLSVPEIGSHRTLKKSLIELEDLIKEDSLEILTHAEYSLLQVYHAKGADEIRISGINQTAYILLQKIGSGYQVHPLLDDELSFRGPGSLIAFSAQVNENPGPQDLLNFLNTDPPGSQAHQILASLQTRYPDIDDLLVLHYEF